MSVNVVVAGVSSPGAKSLSIAPATDDSVLCEMACLLVGRLLQRRTVVSFPLNSLWARGPKLSVSVEITLCTGRFIILALAMAQSSLCWASKTKSSETSSSFIASWIWKANLEQHIFKLYNNKWGTLTESVKHILLSFLYLYFHIVVIVVVFWRLLPSLGIFFSSSG